MGNKPIIALMYDFDKTLCEKDMQEYSFIPSIGMSPEEFWGEANKISVKNSMDRILAYMYLMIKLAKKKDIPITKEAFKELGKDVVLLRGVKTWFKRISEIAKSEGVIVEHYIISSGLSEIIEGTPIAKYFKRIYACEFHYNERGNADWAQQAINFTTKTQFIFRISKGVLDTVDDYTLNSYVSENDRRIPYRNMIYIGDGLTDVPCMTVVRDRGGESIAIYHKGEEDKAYKLIQENRVGYIAYADYSKDCELENIVKQLIKKMAIVDYLERRHEQELQESRKPQGKK
ncbi:MAG: HAD family hydrolase [Bacilli bacterium]|mgnify:FL=1|nr:haloacid dehalogenase-like hydrolase [Bacilli bacterium]MDD7314862.1 HAD family hydrolase [Bacilli bacterium]MDY4053224.1 HAD family hydrolase [Bacilli bacterium]